jgi:UDP-glucose 4-epimerase
VPVECSNAVIGDLARLRNMRDAFQDADFAIHTAGVAHAKRATQAAGVKRFVFLSSVRAQCGLSSPNILKDDRPTPTDPYGRSKLAAEEGLATLDLEWVALRLPLTYGPGVKGNFARLTRLARSNLPLPVGGLKAKRSILSLQNLTSGIECVLAAPSLRRPFLIVDPEPLSLPELVGILREASGRRRSVFPLPNSVLKLALSALDRAEEYARVAEPLVVSLAQLQSLGWTPALGTREALIRYVQSDKA